MPETTKVRRFGGSLGFIIPKAMTEQMRIKEDDVLYMVETDQGVLLTPYDPAFEQATAAYERTASKYRNALRKLAE